MKNIEFLNEKKIKKYILKEIRRRGLIEFTPPKELSCSSRVADSIIRFLNHLIKCQLEEMTDPEYVRDLILQSFAIESAIQKTGRNVGEVKQELIKKLEEIPISVIPKRNLDNFKN